MDLLLGSFSQTTVSKKPCKNLQSQIKYSQNGIKRWNFNCRWTETYYFYKPVDHLLGYLLVGLFIPKPTKTSWTQRYSVYRHSGGKKPENDSDLTSKNNSWSQQTDQSSRDQNIIIIIRLWWWMIKMWEQILYLYFSLVQRHRRQVGSVWCSKVFWKWELTADLLSFNCLI